MASLRHPRSNRPVPDLRAVLLDLGNVLAFHDDALLFARFGARAGLSGAVARERLLPLYPDVMTGALAGDDLRERVNAALDLQLDEPELAALWSCHFRLHDEVLPLVEGLLGRVALVLVSNTNARHVAHLRPRLPILERFDALVLSHELRVAKPDPGIFLEALRRAGVAPAQAAFFDDVPAYVDAAAALGIHGRVFTDAPAFARQLAELGLAV
jgi:putative hydrolase of the HAD superfamily